MTDSTKGAKPAARKTKTTAKGNVSSRAAKAPRSRAGEALRETRAKLSETGTRLRTGASKATKTATETLATARERTGTAVESSPLAALLGGLAVGAVIGALIPRLKGEKAYLGKMGAKLNDSARKAAEVGRDKLGEMGISRDAARDKVSALLDKAAETFRTSGDTASGEAPKSKPKAKAKA